jgi:hypothetical protein
MTEAQENGLPDVSPEFIEQNKHADLVKVRQKNAPYTRSQRRKRRAEVYRLHFEKAMPAIRIAEVMKIDRNTINSDLKLLYREASAEFSDMSFWDYLHKQLTRLERQKDRLYSYLENSKSDSDRLATERMIADIDFKLLATMERLEYGAIGFWEKVIKEINFLGKKENIGYTNLFEIWQISQKSRRRLSDIMAEAEKK